MTARPLGTLLAALVLSVLGAEWIVRNLLLTPLVPSSESDLVRIIHKTRAFQAVPPLRSLPADRFGIIGLSDSFGDCGADTARNYHDYFQRRLQQDGYSRSQVINLSVIRYDTPEELLMLRDFGLKYGPKVVLHGFFVGNDTFTHNFTLGEYPGGYFANALPFEPLRLETWSLWDWIHKLQMAKLERDRSGGKSNLAFVPRSPTIFPAAALDPSGPAPPAENEEPTALSVPLHDHLMETYASHFVPAYAQGQIWRRVRENVAEMMRLSRESGARHVLVILPDQLQVETPTQERFFRETGRKPSAFDFTLPQKLLREVARENNVSVIDLLPAFRKMGSQGGLYLLRNTHWNARGNWLAARVIYDELCQHLDGCGPHDLTSSAAPK